MRYERTDYEELTDSAVLLCLWSEAQERSGENAVGDRLKAMKLAFLVAYPLYRDRVKALNLQFFRYTRGPMAKEVYTAWEQLRSRALMREEEVWTVTSEGKRLAQRFREDALARNENAPVLEAINNVVCHYAALSTQDILEHVYQMPLYTLDSPGQARKMEQIPEKEDFTRLLSEDEAVCCLYVPRDWQVTLDLVFNADALDNLQRGIDDTYKGRMLTHEEMWAGV